MTLRRIITESFKLEGKGLHSGNDCYLRVEPCDSDFIIIRSVENEIELSIDKFKLNGTGRGSDYIFPDGNRIRTCEHVLSAFAGLGIWSNAKLIVFGGEMPALDGCASELCNKILENSKIVEMNLEIIKIQDKIEIKDENDKNRFINFYPDIFEKDKNNELCLSYLVNYKFIGSQYFRFFMNSGDNFYHDISKARTFAFASDIEYLRSHGMALGGSLDNAILIDEKHEKIITSGGLRWHNEFVRHKILDLIGDLAAIGRPVAGNIIAVCAGHSLHLKLSEAIKEKIERERKK